MFQPPWRNIRNNNTYCGLFHVVDHSRKYIPQVKVAAHTIILSSNARTTLTQTFENTDAHATWEEVKYAFPIIDGISVVSFTCRVGERVIKGVVKEKQKAREDYEEAKHGGDSAALLEQVAEASDVFLTSVGNVPPKTTIRVDITYLGELKHDAEVDGIRVTIPTIIAPRYGNLPESMRSTTAELNTGEGGLEIVVDAQMPDGSVIKSIQSPSHPISVSIGTLSTASNAESSLRNASASLSLPTAGLEKDFVLQVVATNTFNPVAMLEKHPTLPDRALMATLVPKFALPPERPEIVFVCDRSGSMLSSGRIGNLRIALQVFLKSLPVGVKFNICSFGSSHSFLWDTSRTYDSSSLKKAMRHVETIDANMGGTEMYPAVEAVFKRRFEDMNLEVLLLTDGDIWHPNALFKLIRTKREESKNAIRLFTLAIGSGSSSSLTEGAARAGNGFSQSVGDGEKMSGKVVRMLKAALTPHINNYTLEVKYEAEKDTEDDFELVEKVADCLIVDDAQEKSASPEQPQKTTSLFDPSVDVDVVMGNTSETERKYDHLPHIDPPKLLQAPFKIPPLYPFNRTSVYVLMSEETVQRPVKSVVLRGTSRHGPLELEIPVTTLNEPGEIVHQLAARKAVKELEEGAGWLYHAKSPDDMLLKEKYPGRFSDMVEREAVRLGLRYQVGGKWCSFVAVHESESAKDGHTVELDTVIPMPEAARLTPMARGMVGGGSIPYGAFAACAPAAPGAIISPGASYRTRGSPSVGGSWDLAGTQQHNSSRLFGAPSRRTHESSGMGLFGAAPQQMRQTQQQQPFGVSSFGAAPQPTQQQQQQQPFVTSSFGAAPQATRQQQQQQPLGASSFGAAPQARRTFGGTLFGAAQQPAQQSYSSTPFGSAGDRGDTVQEQLEVVRDSATPSHDPLGSGGLLRGASKEMRSWSAPHEASPASDQLEALVLLQGFEGAWSSSENVFSVIGASDVKIRETLQGKGEVWSEALAKCGPDALATAGVLAFLKKKLSTQAEEWEMIGDKGWEWLVGNVPGLEGRREDLEACLGGLLG